MFNDRLWLEEMWKIVNLQRETSSELITSTTNKGIHHLTNTPVAKKICEYMRTQNIPD